MSTDEQDQAILRIVRQRSELRKRKVLIENELRTAGESLEEVSSSIRHISGGTGDWLTRILGKIDAAPEICELTRIRAMVAELRDIHQTFVQLNSSAATLGID
jgi:hypothetical protein